MAFDIIFLDFDGVLNSEASFRMEIMKKERLGLETYISDTLSDVACASLQYLLNQCPKARIVISSTWRKIHTITALQNFLSERGVDASRVIGITPSVMSRDRGQEIRLWLEAHKEVTNFVILDDDSDAGASFPSRFIQTSWLDGLLLSHIKLAEEILNGSR